VLAIRIPKTNRLAQLRRCWFKNSAFRIHWLHLLCDIIASAAVPVALALSFGFPPAKIVMRNGQTVMRTVMRR